MDDLHIELPSTSAEVNKDIKNKIGFSQTLNNLAKANHRLYFKLPPAKARGNETISH